MASGKCAKELSTFLSGQLESCSKWLVDNKLSLHVGKCESIVFGSSRKKEARNDFQVNCSGVGVPRVSSVKYLGVFLDETLSGFEHASMVIKKISSRMGFLFRNSGLLDFRSRKLLCMALVQPFYDYCSSSWYSGLNARLKGRLDALQRRMVRFVHGFDFRRSVDTGHFSSLGWLDVKDRVRFFKLVHTYKIFNGLAPKYISESFRNFASVHQYRTRGSQTDFLISREDTSKSIMLSSFSYTAKSEWNKLPIALKSLNKLDVFKRKLREYLFERY